MLTLEEDQEEIFFDSEDYPRENQLDGYEIWLKEPRSVKERRQMFLKEMGFDRFLDSGAVSTECDTPVNGVDEGLICSVRELNGEANCHVKDSEFNVKTETVCSLPCTEEYKSVVSVREKSMLKNWWKQFVNRKKVKQEDEKDQGIRIKVSRKKKSTTDLSALYLGQEIPAHKGLIWTMKFSPDGNYLATGGEDGFIRVWAVTETEEHTANISRQKTTNHRHRMLVPEKVFQIQKSPVHEFQGHSDGILDITWSNSNRLLLSASKDKSVRLWQMGIHNCLAIYQHSNYVTCLQFDPLNDNFFISGSIDGKVRIWDLFTKRVVDWADIHDQVTAICYQPDAKGFVAGTLKGACCHYSLSDNGFEFELNSRMEWKKKKSSSSKKINRIQFLTQDNGRIMVSSDDSKVRIVDLHVTSDLPATKSPRKMLAGGGGHVISAGNNSHVYIWRYEEPSDGSLSSCEYFSFPGVSVAVPWRSKKGDGGGGGWRRDEQSGRFSLLGNWFSMEGSSRVSATWPEEKLPILGGFWEDRSWDSESAAAEELSETWGLVIVTAGRDGVIRTFHNFGLPTATGKA